MEVEKDRPISPTTVMMWSLNDKRIQHDEENLSASGNAKRDEKKTT
jgi:hypothetical protein